MNNFLCDEKNIDSIFFYAINNDINYLGFFYTANGIKYKKDYKDTDFKYYVNRIIKVYNTLKDINKINLIGDLTKDIISGKIKISSNELYNKTLITSNNYDYLSMVPYIDLIIKNTMKTLNIESNLEYHNAKFTYINKGQIIHLPITLYKKDNAYKLKFRLFKDYKDYFFECDINLFNKSIIVEINNNVYNGEIIFDKLNIDTSIIFKKNNNIIYLDSIENTLEKEDINYITKVFSMLNINYEIDGIKTINNNYILYGENENLEYYMKVFINNDFIKVNLIKYNKFIKDGIDFKSYEENYEYLITKYDDKYLLMQQKNLLCENSNDEFKQNINKSRYYLIEVENKDKLIDSNILKINYIDVKLDSLDDIKKLIYKKD